ncbi:MAG: hypothetical protein FWD15_01285 [Alphaproteobacteria bacterium]|nr:hypothetical protein [Alphaproteobacteria bacterium]
MKPSVRRNIAIFKAMNAFMFFWPLSAVAIIYFESITGSWATAALIFSLSNITQAAFAIPAGIISDVWSRKKVVLTANTFKIMTGLTFSFAGYIENATLLFIGAVLWGINTSLNQSTEEAFIHETMADLKKKNKYDIVYSSIKIWRYVGSTVSTLTAAAVIYFWSLNTLAWISVIPGVFQFAVSCFLVEPKSYRPRKNASLGHFMAAVGNFMKNRRARKIALAGTMDTSWGETQYRLNSVYYALFVPLWAVDFIVFIARAFAGISFYIAIHLRKIGLFQMALVSNLWKFIMVGLGLLLNNIASPFIMAASSLGTGPQTSAVSALMQKEFSDSERAAMRAVVNMFGSLMLATSFWIFGLVADLYSAHIALLGLLAYKGLITVYYWRLMRSYK